MNVSSTVVLVHVLYGWIIILLC